MSKSKRRPAKPVTEERILQICNDKAEGIRSGSLREWQAAADYWAREHQRVWNELGVVRCEVAAMTAGLSLIAHAKTGLAQWLNRQTPDSTA